VRRELPTGTVTFLFTDVEGSTRLLYELGAEDYGRVLAEHRRVIRDACARHEGVEVDTQGDACFLAFPTAPGALAAAAEISEALASGRVKVRVGLHTGTPRLDAEGYVGSDVHRAARIAAAGHGGQVLVSSATAQLVEEALTDLGEHRLKDLSAPERIYQLGEGEFRALKSLYRTNLPVPVTPFLGRGAELSEVLSLLGSEETRLLTLTGPGGTGKTRLALQAAAEVADSFPDGIWWVPLAPLRDPTLVLETAAQVVGSTNGLAEHISDRAMLCLFDNFEQVVEAGAGLADLLAACPNLDLLVTSREPLHVSGEQEYPVPPLVHEEGVGLFVARARAVKPDFQVDSAVSTICARLDELPLALELAAARVKALSAAQILERLEQRLPLLTGGARDVPERQRTLRATIEWSYDLLGEDEQRLFARLAVFRGGCTLESAGDVADADLDTLQSLVDKSLVRHSSERYWMLQTIREYAVERLEASGEAEELRRRHAEWFLTLAKEADRQLTDSPEEWLDRPEREHDNLRAALDHLGASGESQRVLELAAALWRFWLRSHISEGWRRLEAALAADKVPSAARANALVGAASLAVTAGDVERGRLHAEESLALHRQLGNAFGVARAVLCLAEVAAEERDFERGRDLFEESAHAFRGLGDEHHELLATRLLGWMYFELGDRDHARAVQEDVVRRARASGNRRILATSLPPLAEYALYEGRLRDAFPLLGESLRIQYEMGDLFRVEVNFCRIARAFALDGDARTAALLLASSEALREQIGARLASWTAEMNQETLAMIHADLDDAAFTDASEQGRTLTVDQAVALTLAALE
jgi:predicted ATPase/class 3 adenylate cyclase